MRISIITEGASEFASIPCIIPQLSRRSGNTVLKPLKVNVPPDAAPTVIARECKSRILIARQAQRAERVLVVLDREKQTDPPDVIAAAIHGAISKSCGASDVVVVLKDRVFENWLLADLEALRAQPRRFVVSSALERAIEPNKADSAPAMALMKQAVNGDYDKVKDSVKIMDHMDVGRAASHSRSFRHFLHVAGDLRYCRQCKLPE